MIINIFWLLIIDMKNTLGTWQLGQFTISLATLRFLASGLENLWDHFFARIRLPRHWVKSKITVCESFLSKYYQPIHHRKLMTNWRTYYKSAWPEDSLHILSWFGCVDAYTDIAEKFSYFYVTNNKFKILLKAS